MNCETGLTIIIGVLVTLVALLIPLIYLIRQCQQRRRKYAVVTLGGRGRTCGFRQWQLPFPRRSQFERNDITEGAKLGNGAFGEVNQGTLQVGKAQLPIAVKHVLQSKATDAQRKETIVECRLQCELTSPFVVKCFGFANYPGPGDFSILLELMDLGDLLSYMIKRTKANDRISEATRLQWMIEAAAALEYVHACGLIHADVAARNLCLVHAHDRIVCKLTDFGLSKRLDPDHQALRLNMANDVWSFGVTMWEIEAHATMSALQRPFKHIASGTGALATLHDELMTKKATLSFKFTGGIFSTPGTAFSEPSRLAATGCLRLRPSERFDMAKVRRRLQDCSLCDVAAWEQDQIHEWLYRMGAPRDEEVLETDLFQSISSFEELCSELIDDNYRADYLDPEIHEGFTPELSRRIVVELKGMVELSRFKDQEGSGWPAEDVTADCNPEAFAWMSSYQTAAGFDTKGHRRNLTASSLRSNPGMRAPTESSARLSELYAGDGDLYTSGAAQGAGPGGGRGSNDDAGNGFRSFSYCSTRLS
eukprot:g5008.t1